MSDEARPLAALLTQAVARNGAAGSFRDKLNGHPNEEEQQTQSMMYAARMTYLDSSESLDPLFLTRKQAQKMAQQQQENIKVPLKRIETRKATTASLGGPNIIVWKKGKASAASSEKRQTWEPRFQAGCHFYECIETGECRVFPHDLPTAAASSTIQQDPDDSDEDPPFPDSFAFLNVPHK